MYVIPDDRYIFINTLQKEGKIEGFKTQLRCKDSSIIWVLISARIVDDETDECFNSIERDAHRLLRTIDLILNISDIESGSYKAKFEKIHLVDEVLKPVKKEFQRSAELKNIKLTLKNLTESCDYVKADRYTITQIFINLVDNAINYTPKGTITLFVYCVDGELVVDVADTGIGISAEYIPNLFNKFSQEEVGYSRKFEGNGLGLALVKNHCEINNVDISVVSKKGEGSIFSVKFSDILSIPSQFSLKKVTIDREL
ncbi:MAG: PAS domain-containing sensor histidine kinase [Ignavibacteria bacterium]